MLGKCPAHQLIAITLFLVLTQSGGCKTGEKLPGSNKLSRTDRLIAIEEQISEGGVRLGKWIVIVAIGISWSFKTIAQNFLSQL